MSAVQDWKVESVFASTPACQLAGQEPEENTGASNIYHSALHIMENNKSYLMAARAIKVKTNHPIFVYAVVFKETHFPEFPGCHLSPF